MCRSVGSAGQAKLKVYNSSTCMAMLPSASTSRSSCNVKGRGYGNRKYENVLHEQCVPLACKRGLRTPLHQEYDLCLTLNLGVVSNCNTKARYTYFVHSERVGRVLVKRSSWAALHLRALKSPLLPRLLLLLK